MHRKDLIHYSTLLVIMAVHAAVSDGAGGWKYLSTTEIVNLSSWATVLGAIYSVVALVLCKRKAMKNPPPLTADTAYVYVYGLGLLIFVANYSGMGSNLNSTFAFTVGVAGVCVDDIMALRSESRMRRLTWGWCVLMSIGAMTTFWFDTYYNNLFERLVDLGSVFEIFYGLVLPVATPFLFHIIRAPPPQANGGTTLFTPRVGHTIVTELLHIGMPLAVVISTMGMLALGIPKSIDKTSVIRTNLTLNATAGSELSSDGFNAVEAALLIALLPLTTVVWLFFLIRSVLLYRTTEFLIIWCTVSAVRHCLHDITSLPSQCGCVLAFKAIATLLCMGHTGDKDIVKLEPSMEYTENDEEGNHTVLLYQPDPQQSTV